MTLCAAPICDRPAAYTGLCKGHYNRRREGRPLDTPIFDARNRPLDERLWEKVTKTETCWLWTGRLSVDGYGTLTLKARTVMAHRVAYELRVGQIPDAMVLDHLCRVHNCVNPSHLQVVTRQLNSQHLGVRSDSSTGVRGVQRGGSGKYRIRAVGPDGKRHYKGGFATLEEAEAAVIALRNRLMTNNLQDRVA